MMVSLLIFLLIACEKKNGWYGDSYFENNKMVCNDWRQYANDWYYCGPKGKILKNTWVENKFYVDATGKMLRNTYTPDGYYVGDDGKWVDNSNRAKELVSMYDAEYKKHIMTLSPKLPVKFDSEGNLWYITERDWFMQSGGSTNSELIVYYIKGGNSPTYTKTIYYEGDIMWGAHKTNESYNPNESKAYFATYDGIKDCYNEIKTKYGIN